MRDIVIVNDRYWPKAAIDERPDTIQSGGMFEQNLRFVYLPNATNDLPLSS